MARSGRTAKPAKEKWKREPVITLPKPSHPPVSTNNFRCITWTTSILMTSVLHSPNSKFLTTLSNVFRSLQHNKKGHMHSALHPLVTLHRHKPTNRVHRTHNHHLQNVKRLFMWFVWSTIWSKKIKETFLIIFNLLFQKQSNKYEDPEINYPEYRKVRHPTWFWSHSFSLKTDTYHFLHSKLLICFVSFQIVPSTEIPRVLMTCRNCPICGYPYAQRRNILKHIETHHLGTKLVCSTCSISFIHSSQFYRHNKVEHDGKAVFTKETM